MEVEQDAAQEKDDFTQYVNKRKKSAKRSPLKQTDARQNQDQGKKGYKDFISNRQRDQGIADQTKGPPVIYQEGCGLQCASRGPHSHQPQHDFQTPMDPAQTQAMNSRRHHQRRIQQGEVTEDMVVVLSEEASLRKSMLAQQQAKEARPIKKFEDGGSMEFRGVLQRFQTAVNIPGLSTKQKMIELSHWFGGVAGSLIASYSAEDDSQSALDDIIAELCFLFGGNSDTMVPIIRNLKAGKIVPETDYKAHLNFYAELVQAESQAKAMLQRQQLDNPDTLAEIMEARLKHSAMTWWREDLKCQQERNQRYNFNDLKKLVQDAIYILGSRKALEAPPAPRVNATETSSQPQPQQSQDQQQQQLSRRQLRQQRQQQRLQMQQESNQHQQEPQQGPCSHQAPPTQPLRTLANVLKESPPKTQQKCNACDGPHATELCKLLWSLEMEPRVEKARERKLCFKCLSLGHNGRGCPNPPPTCGTCNKVGHHTMFHGRPFKKPESNLSVNATSFQPAPTANQLLPMPMGIAAPPTAPTTASSSDSNLLL